MKYLAVFGIRASKGKVVFSRECVCVPQSWGKGSSRQGEQEALAQLDVEQMAEGAFGMHPYVVGNMESVEEYSLRNAPCHCSRQKKGL